MTETPAQAPSAVQQYLDQLLDQLLAVYENPPGARMGPPGRREINSYTVQQRPIEAETRESAQAVGTEIEVEVSWWLIQLLAGSPEDKTENPLAKALIKDFRSPAGSRTTASIGSLGIDFRTRFAATAPPEDIHAWIEVTRSSIQRLVASVNAAFENHNRRVDEMDAARQMAVDRARELNEALKRTAGDD
jgi:hypothetical protein